MRVLITGSRDWPQPEEVWAELDKVTSAMNGPLTVVVGDCKTGADVYARAWVDYMNTSLIVAEVHEAHWRQYGSAAGPIRNLEMVRSGADRCLAFIKDNSRGATGCAAAATKAAIPTEIFRWEPANEPV